MSTLYRRHFDQVLRRQRPCFGVLALAVGGAEHLAGPQAGSMAPARHGAGAEELRYALSRTRDLEQTAVMATAARFNGSCHLFDSLPKTTSSWGRPAVA